MQTKTPDPEPGPIEREAEQAKKAESDAFAVGKNQQRAAPMVLWTPIRCPDCGSTSKVNKGKHRSSRTIGYHQCRVCNLYYSSMERKPEKGPLFESIEEEEADSGDEAEAKDSI